MGWDMRPKRRRHSVTGSSAKATPPISSALPIPAIPPRSPSSARSAWSRPGPKPSREACSASSTSTSAQKPMTDTVTIHTDGACSGNPGPGGWGAILEYGGHTKELKGGEALTTNNKMELTAAIEALNALKRPCNVEIHTDSQYVKNGVQSWMHGWKKNGWKTADKKPVKNLELWQALDEATKRHNIEWKWVKGHAGHELNERADQLANKGMAPFKPKRRDDRLMPPV